MVATPSLHSRRRRSLVWPLLTFVTTVGASWSDRGSPSQSLLFLPFMSNRSRGRGGPRARHARASDRRRRRWTRRCGTRSLLLYPAPSPNPFAEVLEKAFEVSMLADDAGPLPPPDALAVAAMSLSTLSCEVVRVQISRGRRRRCRQGMGATSIIQRIPLLDHIQLWALLFDIHGDADDDLGKDFMYLPGVLVCP
ncbi:uncharacterized protein LOC119329913 isoform X2 [Triticum dicoccoides]|uniref:uncharacterized protein LOC119329913 isoform X2 n=1 Tax=Triticum dicoccoides TaxID=85692 RepID=UPI001891D5EC|nr:uncharacterized protein LOC119329913 isoform X2 [Triticum dicoccoides]XP_037458917.1 uncharacterized protein LOC119329913 isoform X2 [Triticum dicoccoides]